MQQESTHRAVISQQNPALLEVHEERGVRLFSLSRAIMCIGSAANADVRLQDPTVSKHHADVIWFDGGYWIVDAGSKNGIFAGGARVERARLLPGAVVCLGGAVLVAVFRDEATPINVAPLDGLVGRSTQMLQLAAQVRALAKLSHPVLVMGETGTGKELVARGLHREGVRAKASFVALNVANLPRDLVEAELFGHERGAFTGATTSRGGAFAEAHRGTLFLDEIGELPREAQPKLLRVLDGYGARRLGSDGPEAVADVRIVAATHVSLLDAVARGEFRRDLYHRLEVHIVRVPPLRDRRMDIPSIARTMLATYDSGDVPRLGASGIAALMAHAWPGNVRELRNIVFRAAGLAQHSGIILCEHVRVALGSYASPKPELSRAAAERCFQDYGANMSRAARAAGVPRTTFRRILESQQESQQESHQRSANKSVAACRDERP